MQEQRDEFRRSDWRALIVKASCPIGNDHEVEKGCIIGASAFTLLIEWFGLDYNEVSVGGRAGTVADVRSPERDYSTVDLLNSRFS